jgi:cell division protein FtsZ
MTAAGGAAERNIMGGLDDLKFEITDETIGGTRIKVLGVGGGGSNAVGRMATSGVSGVEFFVLNTDAQALRASPVPHKIPLGTRITHGLGAGSDPEIGRQAALEDTDRIIEILEDSDMVFVAAGLGGGTGTGAAPVVAALAKELGALTVAVVTRPFSFEGPRRMLQAQKGLAELAATVDTVISIPNDRLIELVPRGTSFFEAFRIADDVLRQGVQGISDIITTPGLINRDFADVRAIMSGMGFAVMGTAAAEGEDAALEAARRAIECPLLEDGGLRGARAILLNISASGNLPLHAMHEACALVRAATGSDDVQINFGLVCDDKLGDSVKVTVIATGFQRDNLPEVQRIAVHAEGRAKHPAPVVVTPLAAPPPPPPEPEPEPEVELEPVLVVEEKPAQAEMALDFSFEPEPVRASAPPPAPPLPQMQDGEVVRPRDEDAIELEDIETPAFLRRERRLFQ